MKSALAFGRSVKRSVNCGGIFDLPKLTAELQTLEQETAQPDFWKDPQTAARTSRKKASVEREIRRWKDIERRHADLVAMADLAEESGDADLEKELHSEVANFEAALGQLRIEMLLSG